MKFKKSGDEIQCAKTKLHSFTDSDIMKYLRICLNISMVLMCSFIYLRCYIILKSTQTITRNAILAKAFAVILISWVILVLPYNTFYDFSSQYYQRRSKQGIAGMMRRDVGFFFQVAFKVIFIGVHSYS